MKIQGSIALVTGANRGLGKALVSALLEAGAAKVYAAARDARTVSADTAKERYDQEQENDRCAWTVRHPG